VHIPYRHIAVGAGALTVRAAGATLSVPARVIGPALGSPLLSPVRRTAERGIEGLAALGAREEDRVRLLLEDVGHDLLRGPLIDRFVAALVEAGVIERVVGQLLDEEVADRIIAQVLSSDDAERLLAASLEGPELERLVVVALESPATDRIVQRVLASPGMERAVLRVLDSDLVFATTERVLESAELQRVVEHIANSPEVRTAIAQQSLGLADVVAGEVRTRSASGDDTAERLARSILRRRSRAERDGAP
jgi:hypothetical protein